MPRASTDQDENVPEFIWLMRLHFLFWLLNCSTIMLAIRSRGTNSMKNYAAEKRIHPVLTAFASITAEKYPKILGIFPAMVTRGQAFVNEINLKTVSHPALTLLHTSSHKPELTVAPTHSSQHIPYFTNFHQTSLGKLDPKTLEPTNREAASIGHQSFVNDLIAWYREHIQNKPVIEEELVNEVHLLASEVMRADPLPLRVGRAPYLPCTTTHNTQHT